MGKQFGNSFISFLLRSPLHSLLSGSLLLITVTGRKSGQPHTTPVNYVRVGNELLIVSSPDRIWWKNLRGSAPVRIRLQGRDLIGQGSAIEHQSEVVEGLIELMKAAPAYQKYLGVSLAPDGQPLDPAALAKAAQTRVMVKISGLQP